MASLQELIAQKEALERQIAEAQRSARSEAIAKVRALMAEYGLTTDDLGGSGQQVREARGERTTKKVAAKYQRPIFWPRVDGSRTQTQVASVRSCEWKVTG